MKKICLVVQNSFCDIALNKLREVGVVHLELKDVPIDINSNAQRRKVKVDDAIGLIRSFKLPKAKPPKKKKKSDPEDLTPGFERRQKPVGLHRGRRATDIFGTEEEEPYSLSAVRAPARPELSDYMLTIDKERKILKERDLFLSQEIERISSWGDFDPHSIEEMEMPVFLYKIFQSDFDNLDDDVIYIKVKSSKNVVHLIVFEKEIKGIAPFKLPERKLSEYIHEAEIIRHEIEEHDEKIKSFADRRNVLDKEMIKIHQDIEFEEAMTAVDASEAKSNLAWLTGFVPAEDVENVKAAAKENCWALTVYEPAVSDEKVPTKLKNNKFINLLNPITSFLGILPGYHEVDISPSFLLFFCIFFAMIFGDAAYGLILVLIAIVMIIKTKSEKKAIFQGLPLLMLLGLFNTAWGVITCSWFGVDSDKAPQFLQNISLSLLSTAKSDKVTVDQNMQIFCFTLGLLHLSIAHLTNVFRYIKTKGLKARAFAEIGSIGMLAGIYNIVLVLIVSTENRVIPFLPVSLYLIAGGFLLSFIFSCYEVSLKQSIKSGLGNSVMAILGVINIFSDIMSYIRLWAVGLAGASIAATINLMAGPMLGSFLIFAGIILLVFGHGLNMVLNVLSVLVHAVRLNTLEFSGHVGISWSGKPYQPFMQKVVTKK
ncbi:MAG: V-type ATP synthase subunit I [Treponema sp.]|nr:V-type ATP synthase subunit I [Treponema sp.]